VNLLYLALYKLRRPYIGRFRHGGLLSSCPYDLIHC
jgi:hypothetical protein